MAICACRSRRRPFALPGYGMIPKSGSRFSEKIMLQCNIWNMNEVREPRNGASGLLERGQVFR